jgi:hypothetical protein
MIRVQNVLTITIYVRSTADTDGITYQEHDLPDSFPMVVVVVVVVVVVGGRFGSPTSFVVDVM